MGGPIGSGSDCYVGHADLRLFEKKVPLWCNICSWLFEYEHNSIGTYLPWHKIFEEKS